MVTFNSKEDRDFALGCWGRIIFLFFLCFGCAFLAQYLGDVTPIDSDGWETIFWCFFGLIVIYYFYRKIRK